MALAGALTFAELGAILPRAGGVYVYLNESYGGLAGFLYGVGVFSRGEHGGRAALSIAFATYFSMLVPIGPAGIPLAAVAGW